MLFVCDAAYSTDVKTMPPQLSGGQLPLDAIFAKSQLDQLVADAWLQSEWGPSVLWELGTCALSRAAGHLHAFAYCFEGSLLSAGSASWWQMRGCSVSGVVEWFECPSDRGDPEACKLQHPGSWYGTQGCVDTW
jgi:hypothetical protein